jgi:hypothetical protein
VGEEDEACGRSTDEKVGCLKLANVLVSPSGMGEARICGFLDTVFPLPYIQVAKRVLSVFVRVHPDSRRGKDESVD